MSDLCTSVWGTFCHSSILVLTLQQREPLHTKLDFAHEENRSFFFIYFVFYFVRGVLFDE